MTQDKTFWVHPGSYTFRRDRPEKSLETVWTAHPDWGYIRRRDLWVMRECSVEEIQREGFIERKPLASEEVRTCPYCRMYISSVPGYLVSKHITECGGGGEENWRRLEESVVSDKRVREFEARIIAERLRKQKELEEMERKERFERIRDEQIARQVAKDRKRRLKEETKETLRKR